MTAFQTHYNRYFVRVLMGGLMLIGVLWWFPFGLYLIQARNADSCSLSGTAPNVRPFAPSMTHPSMTHPCRPGGTDAPVQCNSRPALGRAQQRERARAQQTEKGQRERVKCVYGEREKGERNQ